MRIGTVLLLWKVEWVVDVGSCGFLVDAGDRVGVYLSCEVVYLL